MLSTRVRQLVAFLCLALLAACGNPVPSEKSAYVGEWTAPTMALSITQDGTVRYARKLGGASRSMTGPLKGFAGDNFMVGIGPVASTFSVSVAPHQDGKAWKMTVQGVELTRR